MMLDSTLRFLLRGVAGHSARILRSTIVASRRAHPLPATTAKMARGSRVAAWLIAAIVAVSLATFSSPARANVLDCLGNAAKTLDPSKLKDIDDIAQCSGYLANPTPTFAVALSVVGAAMATGILPEDADGCKSAVPDAGAKLILAAIEALGLPVPDQVKAELKNQSQEAYNNVLNDFPVLAALADMFNCACVIDGSGASVAKDFANAASSCGELLGDLADTFVQLGGKAVEIVGGLWSAVVNGLSSIGNICFFDCPGSGSPGNLYPCAQAQCSVGQQCYPYDLATHQPKPYDTPAANEGLPDATGDAFPKPAHPNKDCGACGLVPHAVASSSPGVCTCGGGFIPNYEKIQNQTGKDELLTSCDCPAPFSAYWDLGKGMAWTCGCPIGTKLNNGKCELSCPVNQQPTAKQDPTKVLFGSVWSCEACPPNKTSDGHGPCKLHYCPPNTHVVTETKTDVSFSFPGEISKTTTTTESCQACTEGTKSDGEGPCIPCAGEDTFVANGACRSCKPWQQVHLGLLPFANSRCDDICPAGSILVDPNAPAATSKPGGEPQAVMANVPGSSAGQGGNNPAAASPSALGAAGAGAPKATAPAGLTSEPPSGQAMTTKPVLVPMCVPCGQNEYVENNQCHSCGPKAVVNKPTLAVSAPSTPGIAVAACTPCSGREVAKLINGAMVCAADCSSVGGGGKSRPSTNYITDPNNKARCIACPSGKKPNDTHTACIGPETATTTVVPSLPGGKKKKRTKDVLKGSAVKAKIACPPRMHPNPSGTGCVPDLDMPEFGNIGSGPPQGAPAGGRRAR